MKLSTRLRLYLALTRLDKPIGILLLLWPTLWGLWLAGNGEPDWRIVAVFVAGVILMRSAGCAINDYADRDIDAHVARTRDRPLARGLVPPREALLLAGGLALAAFVLILPLNTLTLQLSVVALLLAASYPFTKRFLAIPQAYLGIAFGFGIPMGYAALSGAVPADAWLLLLANVFWAIAYDTEYAMVDRPDDLKLGIRTSAITFGRLDRVAIALCYAGTLALLAWVGGRNALGAPYWVGLAVAGVMALYHLWLIRARDARACFRAFLHNSWFGAAIFAGLVLALY
ncbi:MAG: 4-hydroxybenzoate polyprenyltransferase [Hydrogenophilales bacterium 16-64-46]|nr:MAG: 4-hydroxybenzoate polyprenyltransferase [Hydrogenophilales bacterium 12-64-13]OYZ04407.1 MAG: 4-hydroxybenzoate polyprenyltransferase [Hydrogenophilales bacterium 16-64-46]OZA38229.1 MAG: 4-hydroxybenzoate polyprenyltransferase [Hydrogenophilales bacterium 17-64-34]HQS99132.1 4-hydroxybenzoate octaprenyltransferase [Thiobacillus sp.]